MKNKCRFVFNNGNLAILCSKCSKIIKVGYEFTEEETNACKGKPIYGTHGPMYLPPQYCEECKNSKEK